jgi:hypothetical protein
MENTIGVIVLVFQALLVLWVYRAWNQRHEDIKEALRCVDDLQARVRELESQG